MALFIVVIATISELGLILAEAGRFSLLTLALLSIAGIGTAYNIKNSFFRLRLRGFLHTVSSEIILLPILCLAAYFFFQPYQYMNGGWDPGTYINTGVHIARTGSLEYRDQFLIDTARSVKTDGTGVKYPGLYIKNARKGLIVPQFFYLYPVWIAVFYKLFGLNAVFYVNPAFALISIILIFIIAKRFIGRNYALITAFLLAVNVIQIWNARFSTSEILGQFFLLAGIWLWIRYLDTKDAFFAFWAGICLGEFLLVGITSLLLIPIIITYILYRFNKKDLWFVFAFGLLLIHLGIQLRIFSFIYLESVILFFQPMEIYITIIGSVFLLLLILILRKRMRIPLIIFIIGSFIYGYFIRLHTVSSIERLNLNMLGNYLSLFGIILAIIGLCILVYREKHQGIIFFSLTALAFALFFLYNKRMFSRYPFALRRYIPAVIPAYCFFITYFFFSIPVFFKNIHNSIKINMLYKTFSFACILAAAVIPFKENRNIIKIRDNCGWKRFWTEFTQHTTKNAVYITNSYRWARPLSDIFGINAVSPENQMQFARRLLEKGRTVYFISNLSAPYSLNLDFIGIYKQAFNLRYLENSLGFPPKTKNKILHFRIFRVIPIEQTDVRRKQEYIIDMGGDSIGLLKGFDKFRHFRNGASGRWTLKKSELIMPWFGDNTDQTIIIKGSGISKNRGTSRISLYIDNQLLIKALHFGPAFKAHKILIPAGKIRTGNKKRVVLTIISNTWQPSKYGIKGYPKQLGVLIQWIKIKNTGNKE